MENKEPEDLIYFALPKNEYYRVEGILDNGIVYKAQEVNIEDLLSKERENVIKYVKSIINGSETNKTKISDLKEYMTVLEGTYQNKETIGSSPSLNTK